METMDGAESDCSESYFSATEIEMESLQPREEKLVSVVPDEDPENSSTERSSNAQETRAGEMPEGLGVGRTSLMSKDSGNKTSNARRRRVRHNSETTKVRDSFVVNTALNGMNTLYVMWANDKLCDTIVTVEGKEFPAHSVVLATHSDYFLSLLLKQAAGVSLPHRISIDGLVSAPGFARLLSYMYTSEIDLRWGNVRTTMQTANSLSVARVLELGREFLQSYNRESCLKALLVSKEANLASLHANIRSFVLDNFIAVSRTKGFLKCPAETLVSLMTDDNVNVDSELDKLLAVITWIRHNGQDGLKSAPILIKLVRFHYISSRDLEKYIEGDEQLMQIPEVKSKVETVYRQRTSLATTSDTNERSRRMSKGKLTDDDVHKLLVTSAQLSRDRYDKMTIEEENADPLSDQSTAKTISNQPQSTETESDSNTKTLAVDKQVQSESKLPPQDKKATLHERNLVSQTLISSELPPNTSSASASLASASSKSASSKSALSKSASSKSVLSKSASSISALSKSASSTLALSASASPLPQSQPEPQIELAQPLAKTSQTSSALTNVSDSVHSEVHTSKEAILITQTPSGAPLPHVVSSTGETSSSTPEDVSKSSQQTHEKTTQYPEPLPKRQTEHVVNTALKSAETPRKNVRDNFAPRLTSDYRLTASNPKALARGPIAWPVTRHMEKMRRPDVIVTVGGVAKSGETEVMGRSLEVFLLDKNEWQGLTQLPAARNHHVVHFLHGFVYVIGGSDPHADGDDFLKPVNSVLKYDVRNDEWSKAHPMHTARVFHEVTALFGQLYAVGGQDHAGRTLETVECYSPSTDRWRYVASLPSPRYGMAVTVYRGQLWVAGGFPEDSLAETSTVPTDVVCYNVFRDEWKLVTPLRVPRCHTCLLEMADRLYMIGGFVGDSSDSKDKNQSRSTIEMYDERTDKWVFVTDLWQGRHDANTVTVGNKAYIIGGKDDENEDPLPNIECFDPIAMSWADGLAALPSARFGHACCVIPADAHINWAKS